MLLGVTWYENTYLIVESTHRTIFILFFHEESNWSGYYSKRDELYEYFERCTDELDIRSHIKLQAEVIGMTFNEKEKLERRLSSEAGETETIEANIVISAVGQLNRPVVPKFAGQDNYTGDPSIRLGGAMILILLIKKVAVIGTGCSAVQLVPKTAEKARHLTVFQRTPHWITPSQDYYRSVEDGIKWALNYLPGYAEWHRARMILVSWIGIGAPLLKTQIGSTKIVR